jgi:hypothetical protein
MAEKVEGHAPHSEGLVCTMSEKVDLLHGEMFAIKNQQVLLNEKVDLKFDILTEFFKESLERQDKSIERQDKSIERIASAVEETKRSNDLLAQDIEFRFNLQEQAKNYEWKIDEKNSEIKKLTAKDRFIALWADPMGKVFVTISTAFGLTIVAKIAMIMGVPLDTIIK